MGLSFSVLNPKTTFSNKYCSKFKLGCQKSGNASILKLILQPFYIQLNYLSNNFQTNIGIKVAANPCDVLVKVRSKNIHDRQL